MVHLQQGPCELSQHALDFFLMKAFRFFATCTLAIALSSASDARAQNLSVDIHGAMALVSYSKLNVEGGFGGTFGAHPAFFFHKSLGVFAGVDYITRPMALNTSSSTKWLEFPLGLAFRSGEGASQLIGLGLSISTPLSDFEDVSRTYETQGGVSLILVTNRYYEIDPMFSLGIYSDIRYSFHSPFADAALSDGRVFSFDIGLGARMNL